MKYLLLFLVILFSWMVTPFHSAKSLQYVYESYQGSPYSWKFRKRKGKFRAQARENSNPVSRIINTQSHLSKN